MKKRALSGAAACGLLLLGAEAWPQDPVAGEPVARQAGPPSFRDVLRGKVGQKCDVSIRQGVWLLSFPSRGLADIVLGQAIGRAEAKREEAEEVLVEMWNQQKAARGRVKRRLDVAVPEWEARLMDLEAEEQRLHAEQQLRLKGSTVSVVGRDFVQLREADGTQRFIPLSGVEMVVRLGK